MRESCKSCVIYKKGDRKCPKRAGVTQPWNCCPEYVGKVLQVK